MDPTLKHQELQRDRFKAKYEKAKEPKYKRTWFGLYRKVEYISDYYYYECGGYEYEEWENAALVTSKQMSALRKLPLDAKVKLTVEEINELFNTKGTT